MSLRHRIEGIGNLVRDPELRYTTAGIAVIVPTVAVNESYTNRDGEQVDQVTYWDVVFWGDMAERVAQRNYMKGDLVKFEGTPEIKIEEDNEGKPRLRTRVRFGQMLKLGGRKSEGDYRAAEPEDEEQAKPRPQAKRSAAAVAAKGDGKRKAKEDDEDVDF